MKRVGICVVMLLLAGCGSSQTHFYSLVPITSSQIGRISGPPLRIFRVSLPPMLDRASVVEEEGRGRWKMSGEDRWAGPLDEMIKSTLAADLRNRLAESVLVPGDPVPPGDTRGIIINIRQFAGGTGGQVTLIADWSLMLGQPSAPVMTRSETIDVPIKSNRTSDLVLAMSQALNILSARIANAIIKIDKTGAGGAFEAAPQQTDSRRQAAPHALGTPVRSAR